MTFKVLLAVTALALAPSIVENVAQHDAVGPILGLTILLFAVAVGIFALPVKDRR
jgi:hypothetical protein